MVERLEAYKYFLVLLLFNESKMNWVWLVGRKKTAICYLRYTLSSGKLMDPSRAFCTFGTVLT